MKNNYYLALSSAFLMWLAWPPIPFTALLLLIGLVPLLFAVEDIIVSDLERRGKLIFRTAFLCFFIWNTASIYWVFNSLNAVMPTAMAILIAQIPFGLGALLMSTAFWLYYRIRRVSSRSWSYAALVCFWIAYEFLHQSWDLSFPWMNLGNGLAEAHYLAQWYEYTGVYGGTYWILMANILIFETIRTYRLPAGDQTAERIGSSKGQKKRYKQLAVRSGLHVLIPIAISLLMYFSYTEKVNPSHVVAVQPNIDPYQKFGTQPASEQMSRLIQLSDSVAKPNTEFFIWPETAISEKSDEARIRESMHYYRARNFLAKYKNGSLISGIESYSVYSSAKTNTARLYPDTALYFDVFNAAVLIENSEEVKFYHKSKLVPGVEQTPFSNTLSFLKPAFAAFGGSAGSYGTQEEPTVFFSQSGIGAAPVICYESIWGGYVSGYVSKGAQFIAIITNDGWWGNTSGKDQHLQYAKLRAIESRRWVARSANTGISAFIDQRGDVIQKSEWWVPAALGQDINLNDDLTFYVQTGDYIAWAGVLGTVMFLGYLILYVMGIKKIRPLSGTDQLN